MFLVEKLLGSSPSDQAYVEDVFATQLYTGTSATKIFPTVAGFASGVSRSGWVASLATAASDALNPAGTALDSSGNLYTCSSLKESAAAGYYNIVITKYNSSGTVLWTRIRQFTTASIFPQSIALDATGANLYIVGIVNTTDVAPENEQGFIIKIDSSGTVQWERQISQSGSNDERLLSVAVDSTGSVIACGFTIEVATGNYNAILLKLNSSGTLTWGRSYTAGTTTNTQYFNAVTVDSSDNIYVAGAINSNSFRVFKYNSSGTMQWQNVLTGSGFPTPQHLALDSSGNIFAFGRRNTPTSSILVKYDSSGNLLWQRLVHNVNSSEGLTLDSSGNPYVTLTDTVGGRNATYIAKYDTNGTVQWQRNLTLGADTGSITANEIEIDTNSNIYTLNSDSSTGSANLITKFPTDGTGLAIYTVGRSQFAYVAASVAQTSAALATSTVAAGGVTATFVNTTVTYTSVNIATSTALVSVAPTSATGGLVWIKARSTATDHAFYDTARGVTLDIASNTSASQTTQTGGVQQFLSNGVVAGSLAKVNANAESFTAWNFRKYPRFFDIVTYTGTGVARTISHNLGSAPGCIMVKRTDTTGDWQVYHRNITANNYLILNRTAASTVGATRWNNTAPTSSVFSVGTDTTVNANGGTYVAYLFAHDAGGFGASGTDNVISCGSYIGTDAAGNTVSLGYEPQWVIVKRATTDGSWFVIDSVRGMTVLDDYYLTAQTTNTESNFFTPVYVPTATGFRIDSVSGTFNEIGNTYIYIAIRRGPMKTPTTGTSVFNPVVYTGTNVDNRLVNTSIAPDMVFVRQRNDTVLGGMVVGDRFRGQPYLLTGTAAAEVTDPDAFDAESVAGGEYGNAFSSMNGFWCGNDATAKLNVNTTSNNHVVEAFKRAPGFFDMVCYTGTTAQQTVSHNLGVVPELIIAKVRGNILNWNVYYGTLDRYLTLNTSASFGTDAGYIVSTSASNFVVGESESRLNANGENYIAYLFATVAGVSKVGTYTGTGTTKQIDCNFTGGARFVLIKRTDNAGDWYVWDTARGIVAGNDPYLLLSSTAAEVTTTDYVDTYSAGFELSSTAPAALNANGGSYIFLAIA